jgi:hypothetical protein
MLTEDWYKELLEEQKIAQTIHLETKEYQQVAKKVIPDGMPFVKKYSTAGYYLRKKFIQEMGFAYISWRWVNPLVTWIGKRSVLEVMSGKGALSAALRRKKIDIIATDDFSWHKEQKWDSLWTNVEDIDAISAIKKYGKERDILLMSWAPYSEPIGYEVLKSYYEINPNGILLVIGEDQGGCTADFDFFDHFQKIEDKEFEKVQKNYQSWEGVYDYPNIGRYKE